MEKVATSHVTMPGVFRPMQLVPMDERALNAKSRQDSSNWATGVGSHSENLSVPHYLRPSSAISVTPERTRHWSVPEFRVPILHSSPVPLISVPLVKSRPNLGRSTGHSVRRQGWTESGQHELDGRRALRTRHSERLPSAHQDPLCTNRLC